MISKDDSFAAQNVVVWNLEMCIGAFCFLSLMISRWIRRALNVVGKRLSI